MSSASILGGKLNETRKFVTGQSADVLIVGAGPAGSMAAATLARYNVPFHIIGKEFQEVLRGHARGVSRHPYEFMHYKRKYIDRTDSDDGEYPLKCCLKDYDSGMT